MSNNIRELRLAFLLTPSQLAALLGVDADQVHRLEASEDDLPEEWAEAVARALGVPVSTVTDPNADIASVAAEAGVAPPRKDAICRIGARFAIQAMVAKLGGLKMALDLNESALATAVQNLIDYAEGDGAEDQPQQQLNRLSQSLQITVLTILQSHEVDPDPHFHQSMETARDGALSLLKAFSRIDQMNRERETE